MRKELAHMDNHTSKLRCHKCEAWYPATSEYWYSDKSKKTGFCTPCKTCRLTKQNEYDATHRESEASRVRNWRVNNRDKHRDYTRTWKELNPDKRQQGRIDYKEKHPERVKAHNAIHQAIQNGWMVSASACECYDCGGKANEYHHPDYEFVYLVIPLCFECHKIRHRKEYD